MVIRLKEKEEMDVLPTLKTWERAERAGNLELTRYGYKVRSCLSGSTSVAI